MSLDARLAAAGFPDEPPSGLDGWKGPRPSLQLMALRVVLCGDFPLWLGRLPLPVEVRVKSDARLLATALSNDGLPR